MPEELGYQFKRVFAQPIEVYRKVSTIAERDAIPNGVRYEGMLCYVTSETTDYQLKGGLTNLDWDASGSGVGGSITDSDDITEGVANLFMSPVEETKLGYLTVTQSIDLDALKTSVDALGGGVQFISDWDASSGSFPSGTSIGDLYTVSIAGTVDGISFTVGDGLISKINNASTSVFSGNWVKTESNSDVTSVVGLTGSITKTALLSALNVEDGAKGDLTGEEIVSLISSFLTTGDWQTKRTNEEILDFVGAAINAGTKTNITVTYDDANDKYDFVVDPFIQVYGSLTTLLFGQANQNNDVLYEVTNAVGFSAITTGRAWVRYKGTTAGDETDYIIVSAEEWASGAAGNVPIGGTTRQVLAKASNTNNDVEWVDSITTATLGTTQSATILGAVDLDWDLYSAFNFTINNGTVTFTDVNLPALNKNDTKTIYFNVGLGTDSIVFPAYWEKDINSDDFDGTLVNRVVVECVRGGVGTEIVKYSITNIT